jgi:hypothetical protein
MIQENRNAEILKNEFEKILRVHFTDFSGFCTNDVISSLKKGDNLTNSTDLSTYNLKLNF